MGVFRVTWHLWILGNNWQYPGKGTWQKHSYITHHNCFTALFPGPPGWASARRELLDFMVQGKINRGRYTIHPAERHSIQTNQCPPPPSPIFYRLDDLPATQPTVSKHRRQLVHADQGEDARVLNGVTCTVSVPQLTATAIPSSLAPVICFQLLFTGIIISTQNNNCCVSQHCPQLRTGGFCYISRES